MQPSLTVRPAAECRYDVVALGEVMLRLDPGCRRIRTTRTFDAWEGGGEYNVARGLRRAFGMRSAVVTALADNEIGHLVEDFILQGGVDTSHIHWVPYDGIGRTVRNGLNFTERGFGVRAAVGVSDRGNTAVSQLRPGDIDWDGLFSQGVRWFHTGGVFTGLSETTALVAREAMAAARRHGTVVSYDLNLRPSVWAASGGLDRAIEVIRELAASVDVMIDFLSLVRPPDFRTAAAVTTDEVRDLALQAAEEFPRIAVLATTLRHVHSTTRNDWGALAWSRDEGFAESVHRPDLEVFDRVGGGDSFASGLAYGLMELPTLQDAVEHGAAHAAIAMTTPGDTSKAVPGEASSLTWVDSPEPV